MKTRSRFILGIAAILAVSGAAFWWSKVPPPSALEPPRQRIGQDLKPAETLRDSADVSATTQSNVAVTSGSSPRRTFSEIGVLERGRIMGEIEKRDPEVILQLFLDAGRVEHDGMKQSAIRNTLGRLLRDRKAPLDFLSKLRVFIEDPSNSNLERGMVLGALSDAATKETVDVLIYEATHLPDAQLRQSAVSMLETMSPSDPKGVAPALNRLWIESNDTRTLVSSAKAMGKLGMPTSIELLLVAASAPDREDDARREAAAIGLFQVFRDTAVPPLAQALEISLIGSRLNTLAFDTLRRIADNASTPNERPVAATLMRFVQNADERAAPLAREWIVRTNSASQLETAKAALDPAVQFRSEANREALRQGLEDYQKNRVIVPAGIPLK